MQQREVEHWWGGGGGPQSSWRPGDRSPWRRAAVGDSGVCGAPWPRCCHPARPASSCPSSLPSPRLSSSPSSAAGCPPPTSRPYPCCSLHPKCHPIPRPYRTTSLPLSSAQIIHSQGTSLTHFPSKFESFRSACNSL